MNIEILSINVGKPKQVQYQNKEVSTGIYKTPTTKALYLSFLNLEGDGQADLVHHGGKEKAVCVYPYEHYPFWEAELQRELAIGAFGENLTIRGLVETDVCIGDTFQLGEAVVQVSQPRQPCYKLSVRYGVPEMLIKVQETGYTGFYFRVLKEGLVSHTDGLTRLSSHPKSITVSYANRIMHQEKDNIDGMKKLLEVEELSSNWRTTFTKRLSGIEIDTRKRMTGNQS
ncbi:MOSC domain-containing protein [Brevibacillus fortis]|uniref:MOSC domain-containing protein n=1 Tax=Brevibacillus fortis TaxID=2126352 RepID=A0A2P7V897_9BACL|nr:MOSC domain-containing protein [Brevibacillus fortis]MED1783747.1 MOSC domain-containing protein [Brevibacillus fortis]PSJ95430.1 MOSC domain-containing protein [Brevibacillus fortis]